MVRKKDSIPVPVLDFETGEVYSSARSAAKAKGLGIDSVYFMLNHGIGLMPLPPEKILDVTSKRFFKTWSDIAKTLGVSEQRLGYQLKTYGSCNGHRFKVITVRDQIDVDGLLEKYRVKSAKKRTVIHNPLIVNFVNHEVFETVEEAAEAYEVLEATIRKWMKLKKDFIRYWRTRVTCPETGEQWEYHRGRIKTSGIPFSVMVWLADHEMTFQGKSYIAEEREFSWKDVHGEL